MTNPELHRHEEKMPQGIVDQFESPAPTFGDAVRYLWVRRVRLSKYFLGLVAAGFVGTLAWSISRTPIAEATLSLGFKGIEKGEYPNGKKFAIADVSGPRVLRKAIKEIGKEKSFPALDQVARGIQIQPVIPPEIQLRWKKQDKDGTKREDYFPSNFLITARPKGMTPDESVQLLYALLQSYQQEAKNEQLGALNFLSEVSRYRPDQLIQQYDYWDLPQILGDNVSTLRDHLRDLSQEAKDFRDPKFKISFQDLEQDLSVWSSTRFESFRGLIAGGRLVKNQDSMVRRLRSRQEQLDIQLRGVSQELLEATKLLETVDRQRMTLAGPMSGKDGLPIVDTNALDRLVASDYVKGVVNRVTNLQGEKKRLQELRWTAEHDLVLLAKAQDVPVEKLPPTFERDLGVLTTDLVRILTAYNTLLSSYLDATVTSQVTLREGPRIVRPGPSTVMVLAGVVLASAALALLLLIIDQSIRTAIILKRF